MGTIKNKLAKSFFVIIFVMLLLNVAIIIMHKNIVSRYESMTSAIIEKHTLMELTGNLVIEFYSLSKQDYGIWDTGNYEKIKNEINEVIGNLDENTVIPELRALLTGLKNTVSHIVTDCDTGLLEIRSGNLERSNYLYAEANKKYDYLKENTANLVLVELAYAGQIMIKINGIEQTAYVLGIVTLILVFLLCITYSILLSNSLSQPVVKLSELAKQVSDGNLSVAITPELTDRKDEIGVLSLAFRSMVDSLRDKISELKKLNSEAESTKAKLEKELRYEEKFAKVTIGRELKMLELKKKIKLLEEELNKKEAAKK